MLKLITYKIEVDFWTILSFSSQLITLSDSDQSIQILLVQFFQIPDDSGADKTF